MALYCGIDLHSRDCWLAILDGGLKVVREAKVGNDLEAILEILAWVPWVPRSPLHHCCDVMDGCHVHIYIRYWVLIGANSRLD